MEKMAIFRGGTGKILWNAWRMDDLSKKDPGNHSHLTQPHNHATSSKQWMGWDRKAGTPEYFSSCQIAPFYFFPNRLWKRNQDIKDFFLQESSKKEKKKKKTPPKKINAYYREPCVRIASIPKDQLCYLNRNKLSRPRGTPSRQNEKKSREGFYVTFKEIGRMREPLWDDFRGRGV